LKSKIVTYNGKKYIEADGKIIDSIAMKSFRPTENNVGDFHKAGVPVMHVYCSGLTSALGLPYSLYGETWFGDKQYDFTNLDRQIDFFKANAPGTLLFVNLHVDSRPWWNEENPGKPSSFTHLSQIASDEKWRSDTADYIRAALRHVEEKYNDVVLGYFLLGGHTTEWFSKEDREEGHPIKLAAYRKYLGNENAQIPDVTELEKPESQIFLDPVKDKNLISYRKFHNFLIADTLLYFCHAAQDVLKHGKVLGAFFGYVMELRGRGIWNLGHIDIDRVYRSPDIDLVATPSSYHYRHYDSHSAHSIMFNTLELNNMTFYSSFDHMTFVVPTLKDNKRRLCHEKNTMEAMGRVGNYSYIFNDRKQTIDAMRREFMLKVSKRTGMWWFDMLEGWYYDEGLMREVERTVRLSESLIEKKAVSNSEIAFVISCESHYYVNKAAELNTEVLAAQRGPLACMGAPFDVYSLNDIDRMDIDKYKLIIFPEAYYLTKEQREYINRKVKGGGRSLLFVGATDYACDENLSLERVRAMTEMNLEALEKDEATIHGFDSTFGYKTTKNPTLYVDDDSVKILGRYAESRKCALAKKSFADYTIYFSGLGNISHTVLREIAREAGVHIYTENGVACYVNSLVAGVYNTKNEETTITLPFDGEFTEIFSGKTYKTENKKVTLPTGENPAQMLLLEGEIQ